MSDDLDPVTFLPGHWEAHVPAMAAAAEELRSAIAARVWEDALQASVHLSQVAATVPGAARTPGEHDLRPSAEELAAFGALVNDELLGLALPGSGWAELVDTYAYMRLGVGYSYPRDLIAVAISGHPDPWPALAAELLEPGTHSVLRESPEAGIDDGWSAPDRWAAIERQPLPAGPPVPSEVRAVVARLSADARATLALAGALDGRKVAELRMVAHTMKFPEQRMAAVLAELEDAGLGEAQASFLSLAMQLTGNDLKALAAKAGARKSGKKEDILAGVLAAGAAGEVAVALSGRWYRPVALGPTANALAPERAVGALWAELYQSRHFDALPDPETFAGPWGISAGGPEAAVPDVEAPKGAIWRLDAADVDDTVVIDGRLVVARREGHIQAFSPAGAQLWEHIVGEPAAERASVLTIRRGRLVVVTAHSVRELRLGDGTSAWVWRSPDGLITQTPTWDGEDMFVVTDAGLHAVDAELRTRWSFARKSLGPASASGGVVAVSRAGQTLTVFESTTGAVILKRSMVDLPHSWTPVVSKGLVLLSGRVVNEWLAVALDVRGEEVVWSDCLFGRREGALPTRIVDAVNAINADDMSSVAGSYEDLVTMVSGGDGRDRWDLPDETARLGVTEYSTPFRHVTSLGDIHVVSAAGRMWGVRLPAVSLPPAPLPAAPPRLPAEAWHTVLDGHLPPSWHHQGPSAVSLTPGHVVVACGFDLQAFDRATGTLAWERKTVTDWLHSAGPLLVAVYRNGVEVVEAGDGSLLWSRRLISRVAAITNDDTHLFFVGADGSATCLVAANGDLRWTVSADGNPPDGGAEPADDADDSDDDGWTEDSWPEDEPAAIRSWWAAGVRQGCLHWRSPDATLRGIDIASGAPVEGLDGPHLAASGWADNPADPDSPWRTRRSFAGGVLFVVSDGNRFAAAAPAALELHGGSDGPLEYPLPKNYNFVTAQAASDAHGVAIVAEKRIEGAGRADRLCLWLYEDKVPGAPIGPSGSD